MKNELTYNQIEVFFKNPDDWENEFVNSKILSASNHKEISQLIISNLDSQDGQIRYIASHLILTFEIESAKDKLIKRILDKDTLNQNGTMTYALGHLNCSEKLVQVFNILATQSYESKCHAFNIICEQEFIFTSDDIDKMKQILISVNHNREINQIYDDETYEMILDGFEGFCEYINTK